MGRVPVYNVTESENNEEHLSTDLLSVALCTARTDILYAVNVQPMLMIVYLLLETPQNHDSIIYTLPSYK